MFKYRLRPTVLPCAQDILSFSSLKHYLKSCFCVLNVELLVKVNDKTLLRIQAFKNASDFSSFFTRPSILMWYSLFIKQ